MSRPEIPIDWKKVEDLLAAGCLGTEIAAFFNLHPDTFYRRVNEEYGIGFTEFRQSKMSKGEGLLRYTQYMKALGVNKDADNTMLIWLGKNRLGQRDGQDITFSNNNPSDIIKAIEENKPKIE